MGKPNRKHCPSHWNRFARTAGGILGVAEHLEKANGQENGRVPHGQVNETVVAMFLSCSWCGISGSTILRQPYM